MNDSSETLSPIAAKILEVETKLERLELAVIEIGQPAGHELRRRLDALEIEEKALKRNFEESQLRGEPDSVRLEKVEALLRHIEREEDSLEHDADFLHQAAPSSMGIAVEVGVQMADLLSRGMKSVLGGHHPLGQSVFVNHTHDNLTTEYGLVDRVSSTPPANPGPPEA